MGLFTGTVQERNMNKVVCLFALVGLAAGAPSPAALRVSAAEQDAVVSNIMYSLQPSIDAAISRALSAQSASAYSSSGLGAAQGASNTKSVHFQTAGAQGVVYGGQSNQPSASTSAASVLSSQQNQLVQGVMAALIPSIQSAVDAALAKQQSSFSSQEQSLTARIIQMLYPSITASVRSALTARSQVQAPVVVSTQKTSADSSTLIAQIVAALKPSISLSVEQALSARSSYSSSSDGSSYTASSGLLTDLFGDGKTLNVRVETPEYQVQYDSSGATEGHSVSSVGTGYNSASSSYNSGSSSYNSGSSGYNVDRYNSGGSSYSAGSTGGSLTSLFGDGKSHAVRVQTPQFQIAYDEDSSDVSSSSGYSADSYSSDNYNSGSYNSDSYNSDSYSSGYSSGSLRDVFGDGKSHNVKVETPEYRIEYNS